MSKVPNYRPISLPSAFSKVMEILIRDAFLGFLLRNRLLNSSHFGFLSGKSTLSQVLLSIRDWAETFNVGFQTDVVYIDFQKAC